MIVNTGGTGTYLWHYDYSGSNAVTLYIINSSGSQVQIGNFASRNNDRHIYKWDSRTWYTDGTSKGTTTQSFKECSYNLSIMSWVNSIGSYPAYGKYYRFKQWKSGVLVRDCVPCRSKASVTAYKGTTKTTAASGTIGMLDLVENKFFINSGSSTFTAGAIVTPTILTNDIWSTIV